MIRTFDSPSAHDRAGTSWLDRIEAQRLLELCALQLAPALAAGAVGLGHLANAALAAELAATCLLCGLAFGRCPFPLDLMPVARVAVRATAPLLGALLFLPVAAFGGHAISISALVPSVLSAWIVVAAGAWLKVRFDASTEIRVAVIGSATFAARLADDLKRTGVGGYRVVGAFRTDEDPAFAEPAVLGQPELGGLAELHEVSLTHSIDLLVLASGPAGAEQANGSTPRLEVLERAAQACLDGPVRMIDATQFYEDVLGYVPVGTINAAWFQYLMHPRFRVRGTFATRIFDAIVASIASVASAPLVAAAAIAIKIEDRGPILYRQRRAGEHGEEFDILKLRSMQVDAEADGTARWSSGEDERVTRVGRWIRRAHIDELPQLINVLRGEMTMVGPRPERPEKIAELEERFPYYERRHLVKPGITGWAQVRCGYSGSDDGTAWKLCHDLYYLKRRSLLGDVLLMLETLGALGDGAQYGHEAPEPHLIPGEVSAG
jgi:exopolysaccharide biosynthesis polyprenyl glycosylphosphotransferase